MRVSSGLLCLTLLVAPAALGQSEARLIFLSRQLEAAKDPRARAQAALLLAQTEEPAVKTQLCRAAEDTSDLVRAAAARALGQLADPDALGCLEKLKADVSAEVREAAVDAKTALETELRRPARYYVALAPMSVASPLAPDIGTLAEGRLKQRLRKLGGRLAPANEAKASARNVLRKDKLRGFALRPELRSTLGGGIELHILCLSYPEQAIQGEVRVKAAGAPMPELVRALVGRALEEAAETLEWSS